MKLRTTALFVSVVACVSSLASGAFVTPKMGGGQTSAPMVMPNVKFDGTGLTVTGLFDMMGMPTSAVPVLRALTPPDAFEPGKPWAVLTGKAYNLQYGWNLDPSSEFLPSGSNLWIEQTSASPGLEAYERGTYAPIFGTGGSGAAWLWDGVMAHNAYAVPAGVGGSWFASYRLFLGDANGAPTPGFGQTTVRLTWTSIPEPGAVGLLVPGALLLLRRRPNA